MKRPALSFGRAWLYAGLLIGAVDLADALVYYGLRGAPPHVIFQSIASGVLGSAAFAGGLAVQALGGALHFCISFAVALAYLLAARRLPVLARRPWVFGPLYGLVVYCAMYLVVLPVSAHGPSPLHAPDVIDEILIHLFGVGLPAALVAARAAGPTPRASPAA